MTLCTGETGPNPPVPFFHPQGPKYIMTTVFPRSPASIETSLNLQIIHAAFCSLSSGHQTVFLASVSIHWECWWYERWKATVSTFLHLTRNHVIYLHLRHSTSQPSLCEYISATASWKCQNVSGSSPHFTHHPHPQCTVRSTGHKHRNWALCLLLRKRYPHIPSRKV